MFFRRPKAHICPIQGCCYLCDWKWSRQPDWRTANGQNDPLSDNELVGPTNRRGTSIPAWDDDENWTCYEPIIIPYDVAWVHTKADVHAGKVADSLDSARSCWPQ